MAFLICNKILMVRNSCVWGSNFNTLIKYVTMYLFFIVSKSMVYSGKRDSTLQEH